MNTAQQRGNSRIRKDKQAYTTLVNARTAIEETLKKKQHELAKVFPGDDVVMLNERLYLGKLRSAIRELDGALELHG